MYSLGRAIDEFKISLKNKKEERTSVEDGEFAFLSKRGSKMLLIYVVSICMESLIGKKILDPWRLVYRDNQDFDSLVEKWKQVISILIPFHGTLEPALVGGLKNRETSKNVASQLCAVVSSLGPVFIQQLHEFVDSINTDM